MVRDAEWVLRLTLAEAVSIAGVATAYAAADRGLVAAAPAILLAGAWEGAWLGSAQASVLARAGVPALRFVLLTMAGAVLGYGLSLLAGAGRGGPADGAEPPLGLLLALGALFGLAMGAILGALQSRADPVRLPVGRWTLRTALGWAPGMAAILFAATATGADWPLGAVALAGAAAGAVAGLCVALATRGARPGRA